jgi:hypothetical protein
MSRYYLNIRIGEMPIRDHEGDDLPDDAAICRHAVETGCELVHERFAQSLQGAALEVTDGRGRKVATVSIG